MFGFSSDCSKLNSFFSGGIASGASVAHIAVKDTLYIGREGQTVFQECDFLHFVYQLCEALDWVIEHGANFNITTISISLIDGLPHHITEVAVGTRLEQQLLSLKGRNIWIFSTSWKWSQELQVTQQKYNLQ